MVDWDVVVVGAGAVGAQAIHQLACRGARVLGVDPRPLGHDRGSSHGHTRVFRHAYFEHPDYVPLLRPSTAAFRALEAASGAALVEACGVLLVGGPDSVLVRASAEAAARYGVPVEALDAGALRRRYPQFAVRDGDIGLLEPGGGFVRPEASIAAAVAQAEAAGAAVRFGEAVRRLDEEDGGVVVHLDSGPVRARAVVVAAGAWTSRLVPALAPLLHVTRQVQGWLEPDDAEAAQVGRLPCWLVDRGADRALYGIPVDPLAGGPPRAKVAVHGTATVVDPETVDRTILPRERAARRAAARASVPGLDGPVADARVCLYTVTPDEHFVLDRVPGTRRTFVAAGLSGHGFKLSPALGRALADLALDGRTELPVGFLGLARFG